MTRRKPSKKKKKAATPFEQHPLIGKRMKIVSGVGKGLVTRIVGTRLRGMWELAHPDLEGGTSLVHSRRTVLLDPVDPQEVRNFYNRFCKRVYVPTYLSRPGVAQEGSEEEEEDMQEEEEESEEEDQDMQEGEEEGSRGDDEEESSEEEESVQEEESEQESDGSKGPRAGERSSPRLRKLREEEDDEGSVSEESSEDHQRRPTRSSSPKRKHTGNVRRLDRSSRTRTMSSGSNTQKQRAIRPIESTEPETPSPRSRDWRGRFAKESRTTSRTNDKKPAARPRRETKQNHRDALGHVSRREDEPTHQRNKKTSRGKIKVARRPVKKKPPSQPKHSSRAWKTPRDNKAEDIATKQHQSSGALSEFGRHPVRTLRRRIHPNEEDKGSSSSESEAEDVQTEPQHASDGSYTDDREEDIPSGQNSLKAAKRESTHRPVRTLRKRLDCNEEDNGSDASIEQQQEQHCDDSNDSYPVHEAVRTSPRSGQRASKLAATRSGGGNYGGELPRNHLNRITVTVGGEIEATILSSDGSSSEDEPIATLIVRNSHRNKRIRKSRTIKTREETEQDQGEVSLVADDSLATRSAAKESSSARSSKKSPTQHSSHLKIPTVAIASEAESTPHFDSTSKVTESNMRGRNLLGESYNKIGLKKDSTGKKPDEETDQQKSSTAVEEPTESIDNNAIQSEKKRLVKKAPPSMPVGERASVSGELATTSHSGETEDQRTDENDVMESPSKMGTPMSKACSPRAARKVESERSHRRKTPLYPGARKGFGDGLDKEGVAYIALTRLRLLANEQQNEETNPITLEEAILQTQTEKRDKMINACEASHPVDESVGAVSHSPILEVESKQLPVSVDQMGQPKEMLQDANLPPLEPLKPIEDEELPPGLKCRRRHRPSVTTLPPIVLDGPSFSSTSLLHLDPESKLDVFNLKEGKIMSGDDAIAVRDLPEKLAQHPEYEPIVPGPCDEPNSSVQSIREGRSSMHHRVCGEVRPQKRSHGGTAIITHGKHKGTVGTVSESIQGRYLVLNTVISKETLDLPILVSSDQVKYLPNSPCDNPRPRKKRKKPVMSREQLMSTYLDSVARQLNSTPKASGPKRQGGSAEMVGKFNTGEVASKKRAAVAKTDPRLEKRKAAALMHASKMFELFDKGDD